MARSIPIKTTTVNLNDGSEASDTVRATLLPPHPDACQVCGHYPAHGEDDPHNAQSLYYQYSFFGENGRWPTWADAIAHCSAETKARWEQELRARGAWSGPA